MYVGMYMSIDMNTYIASFQTAGRNVNWFNLLEGNETYMKFL